MRRLRKTPENWLRECGYETQSHACASYQGNATCVLRPLIVRELRHLTLTT